jgi:hypothetical protein
MDDVTRGRRLIFVGGSPRSGTTLVQNMLDSHPDILGGPEFLHLPDIMYLRKKLYQSIDKGWIDLICSHEDVDDGIRNQIENFFLPLADKESCAFYSEKTTANVLIFDELMRLFPGAHFVNIISDPRATIASMLKVGQRGDKEGWVTQDFTHSVTAAIEYITSCFDAAFEAESSGSCKIITVVYERLVSDPVAETKRLCDFIGIEWSEEMVRPSAKEHIGGKAICNKVWYEEKRFNSDPETRHIDKWKNQLTNTQQILIAAAFREYDALRELEYDFSTSYIPMSGRVVGYLGASFQSMLRKAGRNIYNLVKRNPALTPLRRKLVHSVKGV